MLGYNGCFTPSGIDGLLLNLHKGLIVFRRHVMCVPLRIMGGHGRARGSYGGGRLVFIDEGHSPTPWTDKQQWMKERELLVDVGW